MASLEDAYSLIVDADRASLSSVKQARRKSGCEITRKHAILKSLSWVSRSTYE